LIIQLLGTGTSQGVPVVGCRCPTCRSADPRDHRLRVSAWIRWKGQSLLIDIGPDFRQQALRAGINGLDAVFLTHEHSDHTAGLDDIRPLNHQRGGAIPFIGEPRVLDDLKRRFHYAFSPSLYPGLPEVDLQPVVAGQVITVGPCRVQSFRVWHGNLAILAYRMGPFAYITDASRLDPGLLSGALNDCKVLVINALHREPHHSHFNLEQALELAQQIDAGVCYLTHISHHMGLHAQVQQELPDRVFLAWDGMEIELPDE
jgi:phosphoribosyl 1,2-cyclic phosphate phosphodiesterase